MLPTLNKIYVNGLTKSEVVKLRVPNRVDLLCVGFKMDSFDDIGATCYMFDSAQRMIAVNNIQLLDKRNELNLPHKNKVEFNKIFILINKELDPKFN